MIENSMEYLAGEKSEILFVSYEDDPEIVLDENYFSLIGFKGNAMELEDR